MPTYAYHCQQCEATAETLQPLKTCPHCGQDALKLKMSGTLLKSLTHDGSYTHCTCGTAFCGLQPKTTNTTFTTNLADDPLGLS